MAIEVELDFLVDAGFYFLGRWPDTLMDAIAEAKEDIYNDLRSNPIEMDMLIAERTFTVKGRKYRVTFGIELMRSRQNVFRVIHIERLAPARKR